MVVVPEQILIVKEHLEDTLRICDVSAMGRLLVDCISLLLLATEIVTIEKVKRETIFGAYSNAYSITSVETSFYFLNILQIS